MAANLLADFFARFTIQFDKATLTGIENGMNSGRASVDKFGQSVEKISGLLQHLKYALAGFVGFEGIKKTFEVNTTIDNTFNQVLNATKSSDVAKAQLEKVIEFAHKSKMSILGMAEAFGPFQNQMIFSGLTVEKSMEVFKKMQIAYAGAHLPAYTQQIVQKGVTDFIAGTATISELKNRELGEETAIISEIEKKLGGKKLADDKLKKMTGNERAELISTTAFDLYKDGQKAYLTGPMAALQNVKNEFSLLAIKIGDSGFTKAAVILLDKFAIGLKALHPIITVTGEIINTIVDAFDEMPVIMWSVIGAITAMTIAFNANKIAILANIVVTNALIIADGILAIAAGTATIAEVLMALPLWLIVAGVIAVIAIIALLVDDIYTYFNGGKSVFGLVVNKMKELFNSFISWFENLGTKISNWIYDNTIEWVNKFAAFGTKLSNWILKATLSWVKLFSDFGTKLSESIFIGFNKIKDYLVGIFIFIKDKYFEYVIEPIIGFVSKIGNKFGKAFDGITDIFKEFNPKISVDDVNKIMGNITPKVEHYTQFKAQAPLIYPMQKPASNVSNNYSPNLNISVTANHSMDENLLASHIGKQVENKLTSHYSMALADATGRE